MKPKKKKRKLRISGLILVLLILYIVTMGVYYFFTLPIKRIIVLGNNQISEKEIIDAADINVETSVFKASSSSIKKKISKIPLVKNVAIKKNLFGSITISIEENKLLFYNSFDNSVYLSDGSTIEESNKYLGYPVLVNYVPSDILDKFVSGMDKIDNDVIAMISEIEYDPHEYNDVIIDSERFILTMNDGNLVYVNIVNIEKLNKYQTILARVGSGGILYLDSSSKTYIFDKDGASNIIDPEEGEVKDED